MAVDPIAQLRTHPERAALLLDVDGTLAPIVARPEDARVPEETRAELRRLVGRYALVACVTGRPEDVARSFVGVDGIEIVGEHGLGLDPASAEWADRIHAWADGIEWPAERKERKRFAVTFHFRGHPREDEAVATLRGVAEAAAAQGFQPRWGRKVLEIVPPVAADKGAAVRHLIAAHPEVRAALFAGDDTTDVDGFRGLGEAGLDVAVRVGVLADETPDALRDAADVTVHGTDGLLALLKLL
jgi:trehalose 6-phosphate phosphatase